MQSQEDKCPYCSAPLKALSLTCPACQESLGFPNVRLSSSPAEIAALAERLQYAEEEAKINGIESEFKNLIQEVDHISGVVIALSVEVALQIVSNDTSQYVGYERLVGAGVRTPAEFANDAHRKIVAGALFGSFGGDIIYGALSLSERGLRTYGEIYCRLKNVAIKNRTSFLDENSYDYFEKYGEHGEIGHKSNWADKAKLTAIKLMNNKQIKKGSTPDEWEKLVLICDGKNRKLDEFIEAHIYGAINCYSVESLTAAIPIDSSKSILIEAVIDAFNAARLSKAK